MESKNDAPWYEQYPRLSTDAELFIESERTRMYMEVLGSAEVSEDATEQHLALLEELRSKDLPDLDHADFCRFMFYELHHHYSQLEDKQRARHKGVYDSDYADKCRVYEELLLKGDECHKWIRQIPGHDMNKLPEPIIVNMLMAGMSERLIGDKPKVIAQLSSRYRQRM